MHRLSPSLFTRLYVSILALVALSLVLTKIATETYYQQEEVEYFKRDTHSILATITHDISKNTNTDGYQPTVPFPYDRDYIATLRQYDDSFPCQDCDKIEENSNVRYFELDEGELAAEYFLKEIGKAVIISEKNDAQRSHEEQLHLEDVIYEIMVFFAAILIAGGVYWPIRRMQSQINDLIHSHNQFGAGDLQVRASRSIQKPLDQLVQSFNEMADAISESVKESEIFAQAIPHEVRTPLSKIQLASGLIRQQHGSEKINDMLDNIDKYVVDVNELINQIVEFSKLNNKSSHTEFEHFQTIEVGSFVQLRLDILANNTDKKVVIDVDNTIELTTNPVYLRLLVDNLIKNALNYAATTIVFSATVTDKQCLELMICDDGAGIKPQDRDKVFLPFARLDKSRSRKTGGLGLGLSITKAAAGKMSGEITLSTAKLGGAQFTFTKQL